MNQPTQQIQKDDELIFHPGDENHTGELFPGNPMIKHPLIVKEALQSRHAKMWKKAMEEQLESLCQNLKWEGKLEDCCKEIIQIKNDMRCLTYTTSTYITASSGWWSKIIGDVAMEGEVSLIESVKDHLMCAPGRQFLPESSSIINNFTEASGLTFCLVDLFNQLHEARRVLIAVINNMFLIPEVDMAESAKDCHLRPTAQSSM
ncbi:e3 ubiquitin-protein ligase SHPRH [Caerostris extrusa]|uniref:E3 ubiquitin-protein ligase SHPRH n=1 Tax=Caerostris extrusa TaxID=172846 RepID=A0AAV4M7F5_CAEEX|nr:e3 ubiquitin-protein ligase SHPRH [Caerostris extrusa]